MMETIPCILCRSICMSFIFFNAHQTVGTQLVRGRGGVITLISKIYPFLEIQDVPTFHRSMLKQFYEEWLSVRERNMKLLLETYIAIKVRVTRIIAMETVMCIMHCRKYHLHNCNRVSHLHNYNENCLLHICCRNCYLHMCCRNFYLHNATETVTCIIVTEESTNIPVTESTT